MPACYPPPRPVTAEVLTREIAFERSSRVVEELNSYLQQNTLFDSEYYALFPEASAGETKVITDLLKLLEKQAERANSMEYYALVRALSSKETIPRVADAILLRGGLIRALDFIKDLIQYKQKSCPPTQTAYVERFLQRWLYKFCQHVFSLKDRVQGLIQAFEREQTKEKDGFKDLVDLVIYLTGQHNNPTSRQEGYDPANLRRFYIVLGNLLLAYFKESISIPLNLQRGLIELHKVSFFNYEALEQTGPAGEREKLCLLISPADPKGFFVEYKNIASPIRKSVFIGLLVAPERKLVLENFCELSIKGVAEMYTFIGNRLSTTEITEAQGRDWLINVYDTTTEVIAEKKILENQEIPEAIRQAFGTPISFPTPEFRQSKKRGIKIAPPAPSAPAEAAPAPVPAAPAPVPAAPAPAPTAMIQAQEVKPTVLDIPDLVKAQSIAELQDKGTNKLIVIVQDSNILDLVVRNWEIRGSLTFPELIEFVRIPFQVIQPKSPGMRPGRKFISFAYLIALDLDEEIVGLFLQRLTRTGQISEKRCEQLQRLYPIAQQTLAKFKDLNKDARKFVDGYGNINPTIFLEKCADLRRNFMENFSYIESLLTYWGLVEEIYYSVAMGTAVMGNIKDPSQKEIEQFAAQRNEEFITAYEKALAFPEYRHLRNYFKKKYNPELQKHFINVKIKNDLINLSQTTALNLADRN